MFRIRVTVEALTDQTPTIKKVEAIDVPGSEGEVRTLPPIHWPSMQIVITGFMKAQTIRSRTDICGGIVAVLGETLNRGSYWTCEAIGDGFEIVVIDEGIEQTFKFRRPEGQDEIQTERLDYMEAQSA